MRKRYVLLVLIIISVVIFNVPKSYANNKLDSVELKNNNDINKEAFAMYVENSLGQYEPYTEDSNYFPNSLKYHYNGDMSKCVDSKEEVVDGILEYNNEDNSVTVTSNRTVYCYLYFDLDKDKPGTPEVNLSNVSNIDGNYTNSKTQTLTVTYTEEDIESCCISLNSDSCDDYKTEGLNNVDKKITIKDFDLGEDGNKTIKVWLKDMAGNISDNPKTINIILDTQPPVINNLTVSGVTTYSNVNYVTTASPSVTITWSDDDVVKYCMSNADCTPGTNINEKTVTAAVTLTNNAANTIHAKVMDKAGNVSVDKTYALTVDTVKPGTPNVSMSNLSTTNNSYVTSASVTISATFTEADIASYCISLNNSCTNYETTGLDAAKKTISRSSYALGSDGSKTVKIWLKDKAGLVSETPGSITKTLDTATPGAPTVSINSGASVTESTTVSISVTGIASDVGWYCIVNSNSDCNPTTVLNSTTLTLSNHSLPTGDGSKTVCVRIKDKAGHVSTRGCDSITLQTTFTIDGLVAKKPSGLNTTQILGGMYRFQSDQDQGIVSNNICFGTDDIEDCRDYPEKYMYRIIGIVQNSTDTTVSKGMIKIIMRSPFRYTTMGQEWHSGYDGIEYADILWSNSSLKKSLNGENSGSNIFLNSDNSYYPYLKNETWINKIVSKKWWEGDIDYDYAPTTAQEMFNVEHGITEAQFYRKDETLKKAKWTQSSTSFKIGLMSLSDHYWAISSSGYNCKVDYTECRTAWLHSCYGYGCYSEWTMTRLGLYEHNGTQHYGAAELTENGVLAKRRLDANENIRLVFYLNSNIIFKSGTGTSRDPFIIQP